MKGKIIKFLMVCLVCAGIIFGISILIEYLN